jgi:ATP-dependent helicase HrpB
MPASHLPIEEIRPDLLTALRSDTRPAILIKAPTGSGKSTQVPQMILDSGEIPTAQRIVVLQPRRIAARMLAARVASERSSQLGREVGYQVRFDNISSADTRILFVTEGVLIRQLLQDPDLSRVGCVIIDEFHERHLDGDLCLAWIRALQQGSRPDLRLIVMSATLLPEPLLDYLNPATLLEAEGRTYPVDIRYQNPQRSSNQQPEPIWDQAARAAESHAREQPADPGHMLIFMPGAYEIQRCIQALQARSGLRTFHILPMHGELTPDQQDQAVAPSSKPKIIVSTNVAETSLTIDGVRLVIDSGLARVPAYDPRRGINTLTIQKISRASAEQRAGRAGRTGPGIAIRLWPEREHHHRDESQPPEIARLDLAESLLAIKQATRSRSTAAPLPIRWFEEPPPASLERATRLLENLGALDATGQLTATGVAMTQWPLHPRFARLLLAAAELDCLTEASICAAVAQGRDILIPAQKNRHASTHKDSHPFSEPTDITEFQSLIRAFNHACAVRFSADSCLPYGIHIRAVQEAARSQQQFLRLAQRAGLPINAEPAAPEALCKALLAAFVDHLGIETSPGSRIYQLQGSYSGHLTKDSALKPPALLTAAEVVEIQGKAMQVKLNLVSKVELNWLQQQFPHLLSTALHTAYDATNRRVICREETRFRDLTLSARESGTPDPATAASLLADQVENGSLQLPNWNEKVEQWITRLNCLAGWMPELELSPIGTEDRRLILEQVCHGCTTYRQLKERQVFPYLQQWLNPSQHSLLDHYAPERISFKKDRSTKITYSADANPAISVILQHLYDVERSPTIADGRITLTVHLLSPAQRPIATTGDLKRFWQEGYPLVKKDLKGRYPKHEWR